MTSTYAFLIATAVAALSGAGVVWVLARPFHRVVVDLCGTVDRARFWTAYVSLLLLLAPILAVSFASLNAGPHGLDIVGSVFWSVLALVVALLVFGFNVWKPSNRLFHEGLRAPSAKG